MSGSVFDDFFFKRIQLLEVINSNFGNCIAFSSERALKLNVWRKGGKIANRSLDTWPQKTPSSFPEFDELPT